MKTLFKVNAVKNKFIKLQEEMQYMGHNGITVLTVGIGLEYINIQKAIDDAILLKPSITNPIIIEIYPGVYIEDVIVPEGISGGGLVITGVGGSSIVRVSGLTTSWMIRSPIFITNFTLFAHDSGFSTVQINTDNFVAKNMEFINNYGFVSFFIAKLTSFVECAKCVFRSTVATGTKAAIFAGGTVLILDRCDVEGGQAIRWNNGAVSADFCKIKGSSPSDSVITGLSIATDCILRNCIVKTSTITGLFTLGSDAKLFSYNTVMDASSEGSAILGTLSGTGTQFCFTGLNLVTSQTNIELFEGSGSGQIISNDVNIPTFFYK